MDAVGELVVDSLLSADIVNPELGVGDTSAIPGLGVWLVLLVSITACGSSSHFTFIFNNNS